MKRHEIMSTSVGLWVCLTTASEVMRHIVGKERMGQKHCPCSFRSMDKGGSGVTGHLRGWVS